MYGGTQIYIRKISNPQSGIEFKITHFSEIDIQRKHITGSTKMLLIESCTYPTIKVKDIKLFIITNIVLQLITEQNWRKFVSKFLYK